MNKISVLLSTYNGEKYVKQLIDSLQVQSYQYFDLFIRDDFSNDDTVSYLKEYDKAIILESTNNIGIKESFSALLKYALENSDSEYFMFCDQDDIWEKDKIDKTLTKMYEIEKLNPSSPVLIHTNLKVVDEKLNIIDSSFWNYEKIDPSINGLNRLLLQNTVTGCTVMINRKLAQLLYPIPQSSIMHDRWMGLVATSFGKIGYVEDSTVLYRQHSFNDTGARKFSLINILKKVFELFDKKYFDDYVEKNLLQTKVFLERYRNILDANDIEILEEFINIKEKSFFEKRKILIKYKLLKQGVIRNIGLLLKI